MPRKILDLLFLLVAAVALVAAGVFLFTSLSEKSSEQPSEGIDQTVDEGERDSGLIPAGEEDAYWLVNPTSGSRWSVIIMSPDELPAQALILVPGGVGDSGDFLSRRRNAQDLVDQGYVVVLFDPEGRGNSEGEENQNGSINQDGLYALANVVAGRDDVTKVGLATFSYGITMGSGMLARYSDAPIEFLIDWEGPANRMDTAGCDGSGMGHMAGDVSCDDEEFWAEREASTFIGDVDVPYLRLQTERDHAQPDYGHTLVMVNAAVEGDAPWVQLNEESPNQTYIESTLPRMLPETSDRDLMQQIGEFAGELFSLEG